MASERKKTDKVFTPEEVSEIIDTATRLQHLADEQQPAEVTMGQLGEIARELGISHEHLAAAVKADQQRLKVERKADKRKAKFFRNLGRFSIIIGGLAAIDFISDGAFGWWFYPGVALAMVLGLQAMSVFQRR